ncbi:MAG: pyrimidine/purine nucleoside phosphorylase [Candidatus Parcubacteria bacterium]|nr:pyrimidine/purine nucleoside phosphorylase [Candidatus Parcubacteria bacterium]
MEHNTYGDGKFQHLKFSDAGQEISVGVIEPGEFHFTPDQEETVTCLTGEITVNDTTINPGEKVIIPKNEPFTISAATPSSYMCFYR